jgi:hypothetical protein
LTWIFLGPGDLGGVKSFISGKESRTNIKATRTSEVVIFNLTKSQLRELVLERPPLLEHLLSRTKSKVPIASGMSIAIVPVTSGTDAEEFTQLFVEKVTQLGSCIRLSRSDINK